MLVALILLALTFDFINGLNDSANIVATVISSRALNPRPALLLTAAGEFIGPFLFGLAVARAISTDLLEVEAISLQMLIAALLGAILWNLGSLYLGVPSSSSHALVGGLLGAALMASGTEAIRSVGLLRVLTALFVSPVLGLAAAYLMTKMLFMLSRWSSPRINALFRRLQLLTSFGIALSHGSNDAQKTMGVITLGLVAAGQLSSFSVPFWVIVAAAAGIALGSAVGGWSLITTLGGRIMKVRPVHGFASQFAGGAVILGAALLGGPVSTTQVLSSGIMGSGAAERANMVRWQVGRDMLVAWLLTIPTAGIIAAACFLLIGLLGG